jgi:hypothetical protein
MTRCTVATCKNSSAKTGKSVIYHSFPKDKLVRAVWVQRCKRAGKWNPNSCHVCSNHFTDGDYERDLKGELLKIPLKKKLKVGAVPSINLSSLPLQQTTPSTFVNCDKKRKERIVRRESKKLASQLISEAEKISREEPSKKISVASLAISPPFTREPSPTATEIPEGIPYCHHFHDFQNEKIELQNKLDRLETSNRCLRKKIKDLNSNKKRLRNMVKSLKIKLDNNKNNENHNLTIEKIDKMMSPILTKTQIEKVVYKKKKVLWKNEDICRAFTLRYLGKRPYVYLRNKLKFPLPAISTLQRWASKFELRKGLLTKVLDIMKAASMKMEDKDKQVVLQFDEVKIKSCYEYDKREDQVVGRHNQLQVVMVRSLFSNWKQPVYFEFDQKMTKSILNHIIEELTKASYTVVACVSDCGGGNVGLWKELGITTENTHFKHPITGANIYMFADVPHLLKLIRNWLIDTGFTLKDGIIVNKSCLEALLRLDGAEIKVCHNLTDAHIHCEKFQRQNVRLAAQLLSHKTANALKYYTPGNDPSLATTTGNFIELVDKWFDLLNSYKINMYSSPWKSGYGIKLEDQNAILDAMTDMFKNMRCCNKNSLQIFQKGVLITNASLKHLLQDMKTKFPTINYILTHKVNQDSLENLFSQLRTRGKCHIYYTII